MIFTKKKKEREIDGYWNILVVDDEEEVHSITSIVLKNFIFKNRKVKLYDTYNIEDTKKILSSDIEFSLIFLDIVMESDNAGLVITKFIREDLNNFITRIILRTGQPGNAPEQKIIIDYDINDYKEKTELTATKLTTSVVSSLRSYQELLKIKDHEKILEQEVNEGILRLRKKDKQLQHQERLCQNVEIINMLAHQWRQPLNDIVMNINNMILDIELDDINKDIFKDTSGLILEKSQILTDQIDGFLSHYKPDEKRIDVSLGELFDKVLTLVDYRVVENNIDIQKEYDKNFIIHTYESEVEQIVVHLINNAIDAYSKKTDLSKNLSLLCKSNEQRLVISVADEAGGISDEIIDEIFDPYFTTKDEKSGTGLGLYMSRLLVEKHLNGHLDVFNKDKGCIAELTLEIEDYSHG